MADDHIVRHEIDRYLDVTHALCIKRAGDNLLGLQCDTMQGVRLLLSFEGPQAPALKRAVDRAFVSHPEMLDWK